MTFRLAVIEVSTKTKIRKGDFDFLSIPSPGDRFVTGSGIGSLDVMMVLYVEHMPVKVPAAEGWPKEPEATIYAKWIGDGDE